MNTLRIGCDSWECDDRVDAEIVVRACEVGPRRRQAGVTWMWAINVDRAATYALR